MIHQIELGNILKQNRVKSDLTLSSVSNKIKVRQKILEQIEMGQSINVPKLILKSYVLNFAKVVKANPVEIIEKFNKIYEATTEKKRVRFPQKPQVSLQFIIWGIVLALGAISALVTFQKQKVDQLQTSVQQQTPHYPVPETVEDLLNLSTPSYGTDERKK